VDQLKIDVTTKCSFTIDYLFDDSPHPNVMKMNLTLCTGITYRLR
jgi:hypothetical protein